MKLTTVGVATALCLASTAVASPKYFGRDASRSNGLRSDSIQARQAKVHRDLVDVCACLDTALEVPLLGNIVALGKLDVCLCVSAIPTFCQENNVALAAVSLVGKVQVENIIENMINSQQDRRTCTFPDHATSTCNKDNLCGFACSHGYSPYTTPGSLAPSRCFCAPPHSECNGVCGDFSRGCGSAVPHAPAKRTLLHREAKCAKGQSVCGVSDGDRQGWECVDTKRDRESCGGCIVPSPFSPDSPAEGVDCTAIAHISLARGAAVECDSGSCYVLACEPGWMPSPDHDACIPRTH